MAVRGGAAELVDIRGICADVRVKLRYATPRNGVGRAVYPRAARCLLRRGTAERLRRVQRRLEARGLALKVWDAYRPPAAQRALWAICPDPRFVAPPWRGSKHNRGAAVDVTLVDAHGRELPMPCDFDTFTGRAKTAYPGGTPTQRRNRDLLHAAMEAEGFVPDRCEWWHFHDPDWRRYPAIDRSLLRSGRRAIASPSLIG
ncbi:MAG TPA: D-alanyl-D-alanine dipeptidase [Chthonomonadaceae bacterium]|nr:D-alanyl-D-alanine dipeptidase [Chthonomonadaceae bacterium]